MIILLHSVFLSVFFQCVHITTSDNVDPIDPPIFDVRPESKSFQEIKTGLDVLKEKHRAMLVEANNQFKSTDKQGEKNQNSNLKRIKQILSKFLSTLKRDKRKAFDHSKKIDKRKEKSSKQKWHKWTDWSTCSVTCGKGRVIRWRHCLGNCKDIETEMEEMSCQLPECPRTLFGMIKLN